MITKKFLKAKPVCKVTFKLQAEEVGEAESVYVLGDFNNWQQTEAMKQLKDGSFNITIDVESGRDYQFRYLINEERFINDSNADSYVVSPYGDSENSVISAIE